MRSTAYEATDRLQRQLDDDRANLVASNDAFGNLARHVEDDVIDCPATLMTEFLAIDGDDTLRAMANFSAVEFDTLWAIAESELSTLWSIGRGKKPQVAAKDAFFVTLAVLKHFDTWQKHSIDFGIGVSTLERLVYRVIQLVEPIFFSKFVTPVKMSDQVEQGHVFANYLQALYAMDVKFQPAYRPSGRFVEQKVYYSAKHKLYGFKIECSVAPPGLAVDVSVHFPGSSSDLTIMLGRAQVHRRLLRKDDATMPEMGGEPTQFLHTRAVLVDKGYQGAGSVLRTPRPKKQPRGGALDRDDIARNRAISFDRVLVENYFGRMCMLWNAVYSTFKWNENRFDAVARLCTALTNFHARLMPLRAQDSEHYGVVLAKYQSMGDRIRSQRARAQRQYRMRQQLRSRPSPYAHRRASSQASSQSETQLECESIAF